MGSALETLCGQAFGAGHIRMMGIYMQRSWIILVATGLLLLPFYIWATPLLKLVDRLMRFDYVLIRERLIVTSHFFMLRSNTC
jgi:Na+-driven multidrug efflux pump